MELELRKVEILKGTDWELTKFVDLREGNIFRLFDDDGKFENGTPTLALSDPYVKEGVDTIRCEELKVGDGVLVCECGFEKAKTLMKPTCPKCGERLTIITITINDILGLPAGSGNQPAAELPNSIL